MWVFLRSGFYAVKAYDPQKGGQAFDEPYVVVRARVRRDLEELVDRHDLVTEIQDLVHADYRYHAWIPRNEWARVLHDEALDVTYTNFKSSVPDDRHDIYLSVWSVLNEGLAREDDESTTW